MADLPSRVASGSQFRSSRRTETRRRVARFEVSVLITDQKQTPLKPETVGRDPGDDARAVLEPAEGKALSRVAVRMLVDRAGMLTAPEMTVFVAGVRVLETDHGRFAARRVRRQSGRADLPLFRWFLDLGLVHDDCRSATRIDRGPGTPPRTMIVFLRRGLLLMGLAAACSDAPAAREGVETGPCLQGQCFDGLQCLSDLCVQPDAGTGDRPPEGGNPIDDSAGDSATAAADAGPGTSAGDNPLDDGTTHGADTTGTTAGASRTTGTDGGTDDTGGCPEPCDDGQRCMEGRCVSPEPAYTDPADGCPPGTIDGNDLFFAINACLPLCDIDAKNHVEACPQPTTGDAIAYCALDGEGGSQTSCPDLGEACAIRDEFCGAGLQCGPALWCAPSCFDGEQCPDGMVCGSGMCQFP